MGEKLEGEVDAVVDQNDPCETSSKTKTNIAQRRRRIDLCDRLVYGR